ncbi:hypothetical protein ACOSP7_021126 [Xanthoceras sorbifolium]
MLEGLMLASSRGFCPLLVESDCLKVVNLCNERGSILSDIGNDISDVRIAPSCFNVVSVSHVSRLNNSVAHDIARWALSFSSSTVWTVVFPSWLVDVATSDLVRVSSSV